MRLAVLSAVVVAACGPSEPAIAPSGATSSELPPTPAAATAAEVDLKRECVTGAVEGAKGAVQLICAPKDDCLVWDGRCYHKKK